MNFLSTSNEYSCLNRNLLVTKQRQFHFAQQTAETQSSELHDNAVSMVNHEELHLMLIKNTILWQVGNQGNTLMSFRFQTSKLDMAIKFTIKKLCYIFEGDQLLNQVHRKNSHCVIYR